MSRKQIWRCESSKSITTVIEYARYQQKKLEREAEVTMTTHPLVTCLLLAAQHNMHYTVRSRIGNNATCIVNYIVITLL